MPKPKFYRRGMPKPEFYRRAWLEERLGKERVGQIISGAEKRGVEPGGEGLVNAEALRGIPRERLKYTREGSIRTMLSEIIPESGITTVELAEVIGVTQGRISQLRAGEEGAGRGSAPIPKEAAIRIGEWNLTHGALRQGKREALLRHMGRVLRLRKEYMPVMELRRRIGGIGGGGDWDFLKWLRAGYGKGITVVDVPSVGEFKPAATGDEKKASAIRFGRGRGARICIPRALGEKIIGAANVLKKNYATTQEIASATGVGWGKVVDNLTQERSSAVRGGAVKITRMPYSEFMEKIAEGKAPAGFNPSEKPFLEVVTLETEGGKIHHYFPREFLEWVKRNGWNEAMLRVGIAQKTGEWKAAKTKMNEERRKAGGRIREKGEAAPKPGAKRREGGRVAGEMGRKRIEPIPKPGERKGGGVKAVEGRKPARAPLQREPEKAKPETAARLLEERPRKRPDPFFDGLSVMLRWAGIPDGRAGRVASTLGEDNAKRLRNQIGYELRRVEAGAVDEEALKEEIKKRVKKIL